MIKFTYTSKVHLNQSTSCLLVEEVGVKKSKIPKAFIDYSQAIYDVYENLEDHNPMKITKVLIVFDDTIADMEANKKISPIVTELLLR